MLLEKDETKLNKLNIEDLKKNFESYKTKDFLKKKFCTYNYYCSFNNSYKTYTINFNSNASVAIFKIYATTTNGTNITCSLNDVNIINKNFAQNCDLNEFAIVKDSNILQIKVYSTFDVSVKLKITILGEIKFLTKPTKNYFLFNGSNIDLVYNEEEYKHSSISLLANLLNLTSYNVNNTSSLLYNVSDVNYKIKIFNDELVADDLLILKYENSILKILKKSDSFQQEYLMYGVNNVTACCLIPIISNDYSIQVLYVENNILKYLLLNANYQVASTGIVPLDILYPIDVIGGFVYDFTSNYSHCGFWFVDKHEDVYITINKNSSELIPVYFDKPKKIGQGYFVNNILSNNTLKVCVSSNNKAMLSTYTLSTHSNASFITKTDSIKVDNCKYGFWLENYFIINFNECLTKRTI